MTYVIYLLYLGIFLHDTLSASCAAAWAGQQADKHRALCSLVIHTHPSPPIPLNMPLWHSHCKFAPQSNAGIKGGSEAIGECSQLRVSNVLLRSRRRSQ